MEFLKKFFSEGKPLTYEELEKAISADSTVKLVNLADGGYVSKDKMDARVNALTTELTGVKEQLTTANETIHSYEDMDIDGIKKSAADWKEKYETDTKALQDQLTAQNRDFATRTFLGGYKFSNDLVREAVYDRFVKKDFRMEGEKFLGAEDFMAEMQKQYPTGFVTDEPAEPPVEPQQPSTPKPVFTPAQPPAGPKKKMTLAERMKYHNEHPDAPINFDT